MAAGQVLVPLPCSSGGPVTVRTSPGWSRRVLPPDRTSESPNAPSRTCRRGARPVTMTVRPGASTGGSPARSIVSPVTGVVIGCPPSCSCSLWVRINAVRRVPLSEAGMARSSTTRVVLPDRPKAACPLARTEATRNSSV